MYLGLVYGSQFKNEGKTKVLTTPFPFGLIRYKDNSDARDPEDRKSIIGTVISSIKNYILV